MISYSHISFQAQEPPLPPGGISIDLQDVTEDAKRLVRIVIHSKFPVRSASDGSIGLGTDDLVPEAAGRGGRYDNSLCHVEGQV
jgi:hypothetical protein